MQRNDNDMNLNITDTSNLDIKTSFVSKVEHENRDKIDQIDEFKSRLTDCENKIKFITE